MTAKESSKYNDGNRRYELLLNKFTKFNIIESFDILKEQNQIIDISFTKEDLLKNTGFVSKLKLHFLFIYPNLLSKTYHLISSLKKFKDFFGTNFFR